MKLLLETCLESYLVALIDGDHVVAYNYQEELKHKSDALDNDVQSLLNKAKVKRHDLDGVYVTNGPGSFMGVRAGLIYGYTLAMSLKIKFYTCSSLEFLSGGVPGDYFIDAKSNSSYNMKFPNKQINIVNYKESSLFDINVFLKKPKKYLNLFKVKNEIIANYVKEPKVN